jgi:hypothetical protein
MNLGVVVTIGLLITVTLSLLIVGIAILALSGRHARQEDRDHIDRLEAEVRRTLGGRRDA